MARIDSTTLDDIFTYHKPEGDQPQRYEAVRAAGKAFAQTLLDHVPESAYRTIALQHIVDAVARANGAIALKGLI